MPDHFLIVPVRMGLVLSPAPARPGPVRGGPQEAWLGSQPQRLAAAPLQAARSSRRPRNKTQAAWRRSCASHARSPTCAYPAHPATCTSHAFSPRCPYPKHHAQPPSCATTRAARVRRSLAPPLADSPTCAGTCPFCSERTAPGPKHISSRVSPRIFSRARLSCHTLLADKNFLRFNSFLRV